LTTSTPLSFSNLNLHSNLLQNLNDLGYNEMTAIQAQSLPAILAKKDVMAQGKTGSGKTAAFGLGILQNLDTDKTIIQALVLCPTRELADQVAKEIRKLARTTSNTKVLTLCGGLPFRPQAASLEYGAHIIVGTPGRVEDHVHRKTLDLSKVATLVLDEADRMLEMGFQEALDNITALIPKQRQTLLLSATFPNKIKAIAKRIMNDPVIVEVESTHDNDIISQHFYKVNHDDERMQALRLLLATHQPESTVVFCNTKASAQFVTDTLIDEGFSALDLTGDLEQRDRDQTLVQFANKSIAILVATDVAARGLDIDGLDAVINYELAQDAESHVHRIGRTGRAGSKGIACTLFHFKEGYRISLLEDFLGQKITEEDLPPASNLQNKPIQAAMGTLQISGGKKQKIRPGDILGALTSNNAVNGKDVGKIHIFDHWSYVAINKDSLKIALKTLNEGQLKGKNFRVRQIGVGFKY